MRGSLARVALQGKPWILVGSAVDRRRWLEVLRSTDGRFLKRKACYDPAADYIGQRWTHGKQGSCSRHDADSSER